MNVGNYRWKYCPDHVSSDSIVEWDTCVFSDFIELKSDKSLSSTTCDTLFRNRTFEEIVTNPVQAMLPVQLTTDVKTTKTPANQRVKLPFEIKDQPLLKLKRACPKKSKNGNIKTILSKKKQTSTKKKCQSQRINCESAKNTETKHVNYSRDKWEPFNEVNEIQEIEGNDEIEGHDEIEEPDEIEINELEDDDSDCDDESENDDDIGEDEHSEDVCDEDIIDDEDETDEKSLDINIAMPRQKRPKLIYHV